MMSKNQKNINAAVIQLKFIGKNKQLDYILEQINQAAKHASLIILPELHNSNYFCQEQNINNFKLAETIPGKTTEIFCKVAKEKNIVLVASLFEKNIAGNYYNTAVVIDKGQIKGIYRKMHIPDDPGYNEKFYFTPGDLGFNPIDTSVGKLGVLICWDQWFPEAARCMALKGAEILIYPTAIGFEPSDSKEVQQNQLDSWVTIQRSHAIANNIPVISCNRVGFEKAPVKRADLNGIDFWGHSFICDSYGKIKVQAELLEKIIYASIDLSENIKIKQLWPFFRDRRINYYKDLV